MHCYVEYSRASHKIEGPLRTNKRQVILQIDYQTSGMSENKDIAPPLSQNPTNVLVWAQKPLSPEALKEHWGLRELQSLYTATWNVAPSFSDVLLLRLRIHLGLKIPRKECGIEIGGNQLSWSEGEVLIIDDSFEHFVWNDSQEERTIFILDIPHPDLTDLEREREY